MYVCKEEIYMKNKFHFYTYFSKIHTKESHIIYFLNILTYNSESESKV